MLLCPRGHQKKKRSNIDEPLLFMFWFETSLSAGWKNTDTISFMQIYSISISRVGVSFSVCLTGFSVLCCCQVLLTFSKIYWSCSGSTSERKKDKRKRKCNMCFPSLESVLPLGNGLESSYRGFASELSPFSSHLSFRPTVNQQITMSVYMM